LHQVKSYESYLKLHEKYEELKQLINKKMNQELESNNENENFNFYELQSILKKINLDLKIIQMKILFYHIHHYYDDMSNNNNNTNNNNNNNNDN
jgi:hypothetical protein